MSYGTGNTTYCLDAATGQILWKKEGVVGSIVKLGNNYMLIGNNAYKTTDGSLAWTGPPGFNLDYNIPGFGYFNGLSQLTGIGYEPSLKTIFTGGLLVPVGQAWSIPDPSKPPTLLWSRTTQPDYGKYGVETPKVYSQSILVYTTTFQYLLGIDATTGRTLWATPTKISQFLYGMSVQSGVIGFGGLDGIFYGWNLTTGAPMWTFNPGTYMNQFASASGAAYGMFYEHNQDTYVYAINATTGKMVWAAKGPGIGYSNTLTIAGGKVYVQMGENQYVDFATGEPGHSEFACYDAYNGALVWSAPFEDAPPFNNQCNAYGNLYVVPTVSSNHPGTWIYPWTIRSGGITGGDGGIDEVWCISDTPQDWAMPFNDPMHSAFGNGPTDLTLTWTATASGAMISSPTLVNGIAYEGAYDGNIYAFKANTGEKIWNYSTGTIGLSSTMAVSNGKLYTGADNGYVLALNAATGSKLWQTNTGGIYAGGSTASPTVVGNKVYVGAADKNLYCIDADTGTVLWKFNTPGTISTTPAVDNGAVFIPCSTSGLAALLFKLDANTGAQIFNVTLPGFGGGTVSASPSVGGGMVFVRTTYRFNYAVNASTGKIVWMIDSRYNAGTPQQVTGPTQVTAMLYAFGRVYFNNYYGISCVNAFNGTELWYTFLSRENLAQGLSYSYGRLYTVNENGVLYVLDALTGEKLSYYEFVGGGAELHSTPTPYNGSLYVASFNWNLYRFDEAPPAEPYTPPSPTPTPAPLTADEIAQKVLEKLPPYPSSASADEIAQKVLASLPAGVSADEVAQKVLANLPANPTAAQIAQEINSQLSTKSTVLPAEPSAAQVVIIVAVAVAIAIGIVNLYLIRKRK
ncbi:MAG: PQQ-binding-like beta-propeller repeat protein [Candidatus Bathyarchaeia archaeon]